MANQEGHPTKVASRSDKSGRKQWEELVVGEVDAAAIIGGAIKMIQAKESEISKAVVNFLREFKRHQKLSFFVNIEGAKRNLQQQISAKRHGMRAGRPDLELVLPGGKIVFIELKRYSGGKLSPAQKETQKELSKLGHDVRTIYAQDPAAAVSATHNILIEYGVV